MRVILPGKARTYSVPRYPKQATHFIRDKEGKNQEEYQPPVANQPQTLAA